MEDPATEPHMKLFTVRDCISVSIPDKPAGCKADIRFFSIGDEKRALIGMEHMAADDRHAERFLFPKGDYWVTAVLFYPDGSRKILEGEISVAGDSKYNVW